MTNSFPSVRQQQSELDARYSRDFNAPEDFDEIHAGLSEYWRIIVRSKVSIIVMTLLSVLAGILVSVLLAPVYRARTSIEIEDVKQDFTRQMSPVDDSGINALSDIQTQIRILQSEDLADRALAKLGVSPAKIAESPLSRLGRVIKLPNVASLERRDVMLQACAQGLKVEVPRQTRIIDLYAYSPDPNVATLMANTITSVYIDQNIQARWQMKQRTGDWLARELEAMRVKLELSEDALQYYARQNSLTFTSGQQNPSEQKLYQVQGQLSLATSDRVESQSRYEGARTAPPETLRDGAEGGASLRESRTNPLLTYRAALQIKLADLRGQEAQLRAAPAPDEWKVRQVVAEIAITENALAREQKAILERIQNAYQESLRREELLQAVYAAQVRLVARDTEKSIQYNILRREVDTNRQIYEAMLQGFKESAVASALKASNIRIIDSAKLPKAPYRPNLVLNCAIGLVLGLILGIGVAVGRENCSRTIQEPGEASYLLRLPELGVVPSASVINGVLGRFSERWNTISPATFIASATIVRPSRKANLFARRVHLTSSQPHSSNVTDGFRSITTSIMFADHNGGHPHVLVITSVGPLEGKTTTASNLAIGFANIGKNVLLIDGDFRKPELHEIFQLDNSAGFLDLLKQGRLDVNAARTMVRKTSIPRLELLLSGRSVHPHADLDALFSTSMPSLLTHYKEQYDMVIIDTPPTLQISDARLFGRMSDAVVLVIRSGRTSLNAALAARERLAQDGTRVLGVILNDWNPKWSSYGYGRRPMASFSELL